MKCFAIALCCLVFTVSCTTTGEKGGEERSIVFSLPNGFKGNFYIILDPKDGVEPAVKGPQATYTIPGSGKLHVKDFKLLNGVLWENHSAVYADGTLIKSAAFRAEPEDKSIFLWESGQTIHGSDQRVRFLIGNMDDKMKDQGR